MIKSGITPPSLNTGRGIGGVSALSSAKLTKLWIHLLIHSLSKQTAQPLCTMASTGNTVLQKTRRRSEASQGTLTWVNQAGVTFILLVPAARDGITDHFLLSGALTFNLIIFAALPTHDIPLSSRAGFINDCVL